MNIRSRASYYVDSEGMVMTLNDIGGLGNAGSSINDTSVTSLQYVCRDNGQYGSFPSSDDYGEESFQPEIAFEI